MGALDRGKNIRQGSTYLKQPLDFTNPNDKDALDRLLKMGSQQVLDHLNKIPHNYSKTTQPNSILNEIRLKNLNAQQNVHPNSAFKNNKLNPQQQNNKLQNNNLSPKEAKSSNMPANSNTPVKQGLQSPLQAVEHAKTRAGMEKVNNIKKAFVEKEALKKKQGINSLKELLTKRRRKLYIKLLKSRRKALKKRRLEIQRQTEEARSAVMIKNDKLLIAAAIPKQANPSYQTVMNLLNQYNKDIHTYQQEIFALTKAIQVLKLQADAITQNYDSYHEELAQAAMILSSIPEGLALTFPDGKNFRQVLDEFITKPLPLEYQDEDTRESFNKIIEKIQSEIETLQEETAKILDQIDSLSMQQTMEPEEELAIELAIAQKVIQLKHLSLKAGFHEDFIKLLKGKTIAYTEHGTPATSLENISHLVPFDKKLVYHNKELYLLDAGVNLDQLSLEDQKAALKDAKSNFERSKANLMTLPLLLVKNEELEISPIANDINQLIYKKENEQAKLERVQAEFKAFQEDNQNLLNTAPKASNVILQEDLNLNNFFSSNNLNNSSNASTNSLGNASNTRNPTPRPTPWQTRQAANRPTPFNKKPAPSSAPALQATDQMARFKNQMNQQQGPQVISSPQQIILQQKKALENDSINKGTAPNPFDINYTKK